MRESAPKTVIVQFSLGCTSVKSLGGTANAKNFMAPCLLARDQRLLSITVQERH